MTIAAQHQPPTGQPPLAGPSPRDRYFVGVALGQVLAQTPIVAVRRIEDETGDPAATLFQIGHLERLPAGKPYPEIVKVVSKMIGRAPFAGRVELMIDYTQVGRPVLEMFNTRHGSAVGIAVVSGDAVVTIDGGNMRVPRLALASRVMALLHDGRLKYSQNLPDAAALTADLRTVRADVTDWGYWSAAAVALWRAAGDGQAGFGILEYYRRMAAATNADVNAFEKSQTAPATRRLKPPTEISAVYGMSGRQYTAAADATICVVDYDAASLIALGFRELEN